MLAVLTRLQPGWSSSIRNRRGCSSRGKARHPGISASLDVADGMTPTVVTMSLMDGKYS